MTEGIEIHLSRSAAVAAFGAAHGDPADTTGSGGYAGSAGLAGVGLEAAVAHALRAQGIERAQISLTLLDDAAIHELNAQHLGHDDVTDVIAFALWTPEDEVVVGDIYIGVEQAARQAHDEGIAVDEELLRLAIHGTLHVVGFDHPDVAAERAASPMYLEQERLLRELTSQAADGAHHGA